MEKGGFIVEEEQLSVHAGVPRREQCLVCDKPIFLAERFRVGDRFYHRRCLRCARCQAQLTLGNFYETETDGQFCCETCPDEEQQRRPSVGDSDEEEIRAEEVERAKRLAAAAEEEKRISSLISNRLAMFERKDPEEDGERHPNWRTSSLSDEQKSRRSMMHFLGSDAKDDPPPLPSQGPPQPPPQPSAIDKVQEKLGNDLVRESQSVSNIRDMFEKRGEKEQGISTKPVVAKRTAIEEGEEGDGKRSKSPREGSTANFYTPIPMPRGERGHVDGERKGERRGTQLEFKTPRKPSEEEWRDVNMNAEEAKSVDLGGDGDDDVFLSPKAVAQVAGDQEVTTAGGNGDVKEEESDDREIVINLKERQIVEIVKVPATEEPLPPPEIIISHEVRVEADKGRGEGEEEESSATKESDPFIREPSLALRRSDREDEKEEDKVQVELCSRGESAGGQCATVEVRIEVKDAEEEEQVKVPSVSERAEDGEEKYPLSMNPFGSDDEEESQDQMEKSVDSGRSYNPTLNPFGEEDVEEEPKSTEKRISTNPFGSDDDDDEEEAPIKSVPMSTPRRTAFNQRPEASPRHLRVSTDYYGSVSSLSKASDFRGSTNSISSSCSSANTSGTYRRALKKRRAPLPPTMRAADSAETLLDHSMVGGQQKSTAHSPRTLWKKRPAPKPPGTESVDAPSSQMTAEESPPFESGRLPSDHHHLQHSTPLGRVANDSAKSFTVDGDGEEGMSEILETTTWTVSKQRVIPVDEQLLEDQREEMSLVSTYDATTTATTETALGDESVFYRRVIKPLTDDDATPVKGEGEEEEELSVSRQWEKLKQNKESENRNRQSLVSNSSDSGAGAGAGGEVDRFYNKSAQGKWKRRKGPAPSLPVPPKRVLQMLPIQEIRHELEVIEVQQQGLERQGVQLEKMIREKTEGPEEAGEAQQQQQQQQVDGSSPSGSNKNTTEVEGLIMQLFDLVVEKNELFRRQAELMYLRRQHRLEVEQADLEYEIRVLMAQPECNKTDSDKAKEETMISRLLEVVRQRNAVVDSLEMDRLREAQEDLGIKQEMEIYTAKRDEEFSLQKEKPVKLSKKEKKTLKEEKKKLKNKKLDVDKDYDETETSPSDKSLNASGGTSLEKMKKKKKKFLIL